LHAGERERERELGGGQLSLLIEHTPSTFVKADNAEGSSQSACQNHQHAAF